MGLFLHTIEKWSLDFYSMSFLWTAHKDDMFNLVFMCVNLVVVCVSFPGLHTHTTTGFRESYLHAVHKQWCAKEIKGSFLNGVKKWSLDWKVMLHYDGKLHIDVKFRRCYLFTVALSEINFSKIIWESQLLTRVDIYVSS